MDSPDQWKKCLGICDPPVTDKVFAGFALSADLCSSLLSFKLQSSETNTNKAYSRGVRLFFLESYSSKIEGASKCSQKLLRQNATLSEVKEPKNLRIHMLHMLRACCRICTRGSTLHVPHGSGHDVSMLMLHDAVVRGHISFPCYTCCGQNACSDVRGNTDCTQCGPERTHGFPHAACV